MATFFVISGALLLALFILVVCIGPFVIIAWHTIRNFQAVRHGQPPPHVPHVKTVNSQPPVQAVPQKGQDKG